MEGYIGQVKIFAGAKAPTNWAFCNGQSLSVKANPVLFSLFKTTYGGDGKRFFNLPDLRGRIPVHQTGKTNDLNLGDSPGTVQESISVDQMALHAHPMQASRTSPEIPKLEASVVCNTDPMLFYKENESPTHQAVPLSSRAVGYTGAGVPHYNLMPYQCVNFIICLSGTPPQV
jgi:microcystin-dependent protein